MRRVTTIVVVTFAVLAASCSDDGGTKSARSPVEVVSVKAPDATAAAETAKTTFTISGGGSGGADVTADGAFDLDAGRGVITTELPAVAGVPLGKIEAVVDGGALYWKVPGLLADQVGKDWVKLDVGEASNKLAGVDISGLARAGTGNPTYALENLRGATDVTVVGEERVRGDLTTHYKAVVDVDKAIAAAPEDQRDALKRANDFLGNRTIPADVWLDVEGRLRKLQYSVDLSKSGAPGSDQAGKPTFTYELYEFGTVVKADVPSKDQTANLTDLLPG